jgi:hypothetical protein
MPRWRERRSCGRGLVAKSLIHSRELVAVIGELPEHLLNPRDLVGVPDPARVPPHHHPLPAWRLATSMPAGSVGLRAHRRPDLECRRRDNGCEVSGYGVPDERPISDNACQEYRRLSICNVVQDTSWCIVMPAARVWTPARRSAHCWPPVVDTMTPDLPMAA